MSNRHPLGYLNAIVLVSESLNRGQTMKEIYDRSFVLPQLMRREQEMVRQRTKNSIIKALTVIKMKTAQTLLDEARAINASLERSKQHLVASVNQSETAAQILHSDGQILTQALKDHKTELKGALLSTKRRLNRIKQAEVIERLLFTVSMAFYIGVVIFIFLSRLRVFYLIYLFFFPCRDSSANLDNGLAEEL